jgi:ADP-ribose pyrophosphatase YjhB (NUDIX family)
MNYCSQCGKELSYTIPAGDDRHRHVCPACDTVHYQNPNIITGCIAVHEDRVLLCKRAIEPRAGLWTLPAGFLENGETLSEGALRESREEANANLALEGLYGIFDITHINQVYMLYRATLLDLSFHPGDESLETALFAESEIPWDALAFPVIGLALEHFYEDLARGDFTLKTGRIQKRMRSS